MGDLCVSKSVPKTHSQQTMVPRSSLYKELQGAEAPMSTPLLTKPVDMWWGYVD